MYKNVDNLQTFVSELLVNIGTEEGIKIWNFLSYFFIIILFFLAFAHTKIYNLNDKSRYTRFINSYDFYSAIIALSIITLRFPHLSKLECNVDESQWIANAITLLHDARYWLSVDGTTSGPLISLPLIVIKIFGGTINYGTVKLFGVLIWVASIIFIYRSLLLVLQKTIARLAILPLIICVSSFTSCDYLAYNGEHIPILFLSISIFLVIIIQNRSNRSKFIYVILLGLLLGCIPFSKLQAVPIALSIAFYTFFLLRKHYFLIFIIAGILPCLLIFIYLFSIDIFYDFWTSYIVNNLIYASRGTGHNLNFFQKIKFFPDFLLQVKDTYYFFLLQIIIIAVSALFLILKFRKQLTKTECKLIFFAFLIFFSSLYSVIQPGNPFPHYLLLLIIPFSLLASILLGILYNKFYSLTTHSFYRFSLTISIVLLFVTGLIAFMSKNFSVFEEALVMFNTANSGNELIRKVLYYAKPGDRVAIWGWANRLYVETQMPQGCRDPHSFYQIISNPAQEYYLERYASDIRTNRPAFFLDAVSPGQFAFADSISQGHKNFSEIKNVIDSLYRYIGIADGIKIYMLKNRKHIFGNTINVLSELNQFPDTTKRNITLSVDMVNIDTSLIKVSGWAFIYGQNATNSTISLIFKSNNTSYISKPLVYMRPDVTDYFKNFNLTRSGYLIYIPKAEFKSDTYKMGIYIENNASKAKEFIWTDKKIDCQNCN